MPEANVSIQINNNDISYESAPIDNGFNIVCLVNSQSGTYDLNKVASKSSFIKDYLLSSAILAEDDDTVKHAGYILNYSGAYIKRVGSCPFKQGITSLAEPFLFTEDNDLINKYYTLDIKKWTDDLKYYYIGYNKTCYYTGDISEMEELEKNKFTDFIEVSNEKSVDLLISLFYKFCKEEITLLASSDSSLTTRESLSFSKNLNVEEIRNGGVYRLVKNTETTFNTGDFLQIRNKTYYYQGDGSFSPSRYTNPIAIYSNKTTSDFDPRIFFIKVLADVQKDATIYNPMPEIRGDGGLRLKYKNVEGVWELSENCLQKLRLLDTNKTLAIFDNDDLIENGTVKCTFHKDPEEVPPPVIEAITSKVSEPDGLATLETTDAITLADKTTYKITLPQITNKYDWSTPITCDSSDQGGTATVTAVIDSQKTGKTYKLKIKTISTTQREEKTLTVLLNDSPIHTQKIDMASADSVSDTEVVLPIVTNGNLKITMENATFADVTLTEYDETNKVRIALLKLNEETIQEIELDFTDNNVINNKIIDNIELSDNGKLSLTLDKATFDSGSKIESVFQEELTDDELNGIDLELHFVVGIPTEIPSDNSISIELSESGLNPIVILNDIFNKFDALEDEDLDEVGLDNFEISSTGVFETYFYKREKITKGTNRGNDIKSIEIKDDAEEITYVYNFVSDAYIATSQKKSDFWIKIDENLFYVGKYAPKVKCESRKVLSKEPITFEDFMNKFEDALSLYYQDVGVYQDLLTFLTDFTLEFSEIDVVKKEVTQATSARFAIIQKFITKSDIFSYSYVPVERDDGAEVWNITLGFKDNNNTYDISLDPKIIDGFGRSLYYDRVNDPYLTIKILDGVNMLETMPTYKWGSEVKPKNPSTADYVSAINSLLEIENISVDIIWDTGKAHPNITRACDNVAKELHALNVVSLPTEYNGDKTGLRQVKEYLDNLALNSKDSRILWAKILSGDVGNFATYINGSALAIRNYIELFKGGETRFCAQLGTNYATVTGSHKILLKESDRNDLLDNYRVCTIKGGDGVYAYHINSHYTTQSVKSSYKFEQNVRIMNTIMHGADRICYTKIGLPNNFFTRDLTKTQLNEFIERTCINNQIFALEDYKVVVKKSGVGIMDVEIWVLYMDAVEYVRIYGNTITTTGE